MSGGAIAEADKRSLALAATHAAAEAAADLMRYAREGEWFKGSPFHPDIEPLEKLCDAAKMVAEIVDEQPDAEGDRNQLHGALVKFLEGWA